MGDRCRQIRWQWPNFSSNFTSFPLSSGLHLTPCPGLPSASCYVSWSHFLTSLTLSLFLCREERIALSKQAADIVGRCHPQRSNSKGISSFLTINEPIFSRCVAALADLQTFSFASAQQHYEMSIIGLSL